MLFKYKVTTKEGQAQDGSIDAPSLDLAIGALQRRGLIVITVSPVKKIGGFFKNISFFGGIKNRDIVMMSRQIATLFEAKVSALTTFRMLAEETENPTLRVKLTEVTDDIKGGMTISQALSKHPEAFSPFFVSMVKSGEETGKLSEAFSYLADYLERSYEMVSKTKNALVYPAFVVLSFIIVMILMMTFVIPKLGEMLTDTGQQLPLYTRAIIGTSNFFVNYSFILLIVILGLGIFFLKYMPTPAGRLAIGRFKLTVPYFGMLYKKLYLSRIADNLNTMLTSGISSVRALEITASVVDNDIYKQILTKVADDIKSGSPMSAAFAKHTEFPNIIVQMLKVGEETGKTGFVLETLARFYQREVNNEVETIVGLIEPAMIVILGVGVGVLLAAVLVPIYNIASSL
ncbi:MAG: type II secretion system F family protein [bacterium]